MNPLLIPPSACAVVSFALGAFVLSKDPRSIVHRVFAFFCWETTWWQVCWFATYFCDDPVRKDLIMRIAYIIITVLPVTYYHYAVRFLGKDDEWPLVRLGYVVAIAIFLPLLWTTDWYIAGHIDHWWGYYPRVGALHPVYLVGTIAIIARSWVILRAGARDSRLDPATRNRNRFAFYSHFIYSLAAVEYAITYGVIDIYPVGVFALLAAFGITTYAIVRYRLMDITIAATRAGLFLSIYVPLLVLPFVAGKLFEPWLTRWVGVDWWMIPAACEALFALGGLAVYRFAQRRAEDRLLAEQRHYQATLMNAAKGMTQIRELQRLLEVTVRLLTSSMKLTHAAIFLWQPKTQQQVLTACHGYTTLRHGLTLKADDAIIEWLKKEQAPLVTEELPQRIPGARTLNQLVDSLKRLEASVVVPSFADEHLIGFLVLGDKKSGHMYSQDDLNVLQTLANQAALAIENARFYESEKERQAALFHTASLASLGTMASSMSHQVNNRFNVVSVTASMQRQKLEQLLHNQPHDPEALHQAVEECRAHFKSLEEEALRGGEIVSAIRKIARPSQDGYHPLDLSEAIQAAVNILQYKIHLETVDFQRSLPAELPKLKGDVAQLGECFLNLIDNAYDTIQEKTSRLKPPAYKGAIHIQARAADEGGKRWLVIDVSDNGLGMDEKTREGLFVPFFTTKATAEKGTGLGLYVIKKIIEAHGGAISVTSAYGVGTTFTLRVPALSE